MSDRVRGGGSGPGDAPPVDQELHPISISCHGVTLGKVLFAVLAIWVAIAVIGILIKGLFWLFVIGLVLFLITLATSGRRRDLLRR